MKLFAMMPGGRTVPVLKVVSEYRDPVSSQRMVIVDVTDAKGKAISVALPARQLVQG